MARNLLRAGSLLRLAHELVVSLDRKKQQRPVRRRHGDVVHDRALADPPPLRAHRVRLEEVPQEPLRPVTGRSPDASAPGAPRPDNVQRTRPAIATLFIQHVTKVVPVL